MEGGVWFLHIGSVSGAVCGGVRGQVGGGVFFQHGNCMSMVTACVVCMCEWCGLRIELVVETGCSVVGALVGGRCVGELGCIRVSCLLSGQGCYAVLCFVLRCMRVIVYVMGC